jgi:large subunit ribosomal protein L10
MSKLVKQMQMTALAQTFEKVRDLVVLRIEGLDARTDNQIRRELRQKNIRLLRVKNRLAKLAFARLGLHLENIWEGPTTLAWGSISLAELSRELESLAKRHDKIQFKGAVADGQQVTFDQALKMPTRAEVLGRLMLLMQSPASRLAGQLLGPAGRLASQLKSRCEAEGQGAAAAAG